MTDKLALAAEAALAIYTDRYGDPTNDVLRAQRMNWLLGFKEGARWALESEAVRALIEDLKLIQSMNGRNDGCSYCAKIAHKALSNWNETRGEK